jgi:nucleoside 2-deoxyribosyltransferase
MKVYLAGGLRSGWQDVVKASVPEHEYLDPRIDKPKAVEEYTAQDIAMIEACDVVFAYFEATNPAGYDMMLEIGYAKALGKRIIFVDEKSAVGDVPARYFGMARMLADYAATSLNDGLCHLSV